MVAISFPASPSVNDTFTANGKTWQWNGTFWSLVVSGASVADGSVSTAKIADSAITAAKIADGTVVAAEIANNAITTDKIAAGAVTAAKLGNDISLTPADGSITAAKLASNAVTEAKIGSGAVTQAKLTSGLSGITVTTTSLRSSVIPSPFTGQFAFMTDTNAFIRWDGSAWVTAIVTVPSEAPSGLAFVSSTETTATISFAAGADGGSAITNYQYALSTDGGSAYGSYNALNPVDATSPITITGLTAGTAYYVKLKAVNAQGTSIVESPALSFSTIGLNITYLVVGAGGGGSSIISGGGGAGGYRTSTLLKAKTNLYAVTVGAGGKGGTGYSDTPVAESGYPGFNSSFDNISSTGGGGAVGWPGTTPSSTPAGQNTYTKNGGSGAGGGGSSNTVGGTGNLGNYTPVEGYAGGNASDPFGAGGGGAGGVGVMVSATPNLTSGGIGAQSSITGTAIYYAGGGGGGARISGAGNGPSLGGSGGGGISMTASTFSSSQNGGTNLGGGGGGGNYPGPSAGNQSGGTGGSGVVILRYPDVYAITVGAGLTASHTNTAVGTNEKYTRLTAGSGNVSWELA